MVKACTWLQCSPCGILGAADRHRVRYSRQAGAGRRAFEHAGCTSVPTGVLAARGHSCAGVTGLSQDPGLGAGIGGILQGQQPAPSESAACSWHYIGCCKTECWRHLCPAEMDQAQHAAQADGGPSSDHAAGPELALHSQPCTREGRCDCDTVLKSWHCNRPLGCTSPPTRCGFHTAGSPWHCS